MTIKYEVHILKWDGINFTSYFEFVSFFETEELAEKHILNNGIKGKSYCIIKTYNL